VTPGPEPVCLAGAPASSGLARGRLVLLDDPGPGGQTRGAGAAPALASALEEARRQLGALVGAVQGDDDATALLEFQSAMLDDPVVTAPAFEALGAGGDTSAEEAWSAAAELQIALYRDAADPYFRGRAIDLEDLRDRVLRCLAGATAATAAGDAILVARDLPPSRFLEITWAGGGIALREGSAQSHVALLARARGVPMVVGVGGADLGGHGEALLDGDEGRLVASPDARAIAAFSARPAAAGAAAAAERAFRAGPALLPDGEQVLVQLNLDDPGELETLEAAHCDGVGLVRTELLLRRMADLTDEERQLAAYRRVLAWAAGKPVTIRTLDAGGDKPIEGYTLEGESHPFLGVRGLRLSLLRPEVLAVQLRALARAAVFGPLRVMAPMVTLPAELVELRRLMAEAVGRLTAAGVPCRAPPLGMMVEVPAAALALDLFEADFVSLGSNDLVQYLTASCRDSTRLAALQDPLQPGVLRLIERVIDDARKRGLEVSVCGDMASDPRCVPALLAAGLRCFSVAPAALGRVKMAIAHFTPAGPPPASRGGTR
jgi:phosphoenolpyruvate-protein phosphotransferase (PTS system enzyme I)